MNRGGGDSPFTPILSAQWTFPTWGRCRTPRPRPHHEQPPRRSGEDFLAPPRSTPGEMGLVDAALAPGLDGGHRSHAAEYVNHPVTVYGTGGRVHAAGAGRPEQVSGLRITALGGNRRRTDQFQSSAVADYAGRAVGFLAVAVVGLEVESTVLLPYGLARLGRGRRRTGRHDRRNGRPGIVA